MITFIAQVAFVAAISFFGAQRINQIEINPESHDIYKEIRSYAALAAGVIPGLVVGVWFHSWSLHYFTGAVGAVAGIVAFRGYYKLPLQVFDSKNNPVDVESVLTGAVSYVWGKASSAVRFIRANW